MIFQCMPSIDTVIIILSLSQALPNKLRLTTSCSLESHHSKLINTKNMNKLWRVQIYFFVCVSHILRMLRSGLSVLIDFFACVSFYHQHSRILCIYECQVNICIIIIDDSVVHMRNGAGYIWCVHLSTYADTHNKRKFNSNDRSIVLCVCECVLGWREFTQRHFVASIYLSLRLASWLTRATEQCKYVRTYIYAYRDCDLRVHFINIITSDYDYCHHHCSHCSLLIINIYIWTNINEYDDFQQWQLWYDIYMYGRWNDTANEQYLLFCRPHIMTLIRMALKANICSEYTDRYIYTWTQKHF